MEKQIEQIISLLITRGRLYNACTTKVDTLVELAHLSAYSELLHILGFTVAFKNSLPSRIHYIQLTDETGTTITVKVGEYPVDK